MTRKTKIILIGTGCIALIIACIINLPVLIKWYALRTYPEISYIDTVKLNWEGITFQNVRISKTNLDADLKTVHVTYSQDILIDGGNITIIPKTHSNNTTNSKSLKINAKNLYVSIIYGNISASLESASLTNGKACFTTATVRHPNIKNLTAEQGCIENNIAQIESAWISVDLPINIPTIDTTQNITAQNINIDLSNKTVFINKTIAPVAELHQVSLSWPEKRVSAVQITTNHPWIIRNGLIFIHHIIAELNNDKIFITQGENREIELTIDPVTWSTTSNVTDCWDWISTLQIASNDSKTFELNKNDDITGQFGFEIIFKPKPVIKITNTCALDCKHPIISDLKKQFTYYAYDPDGHFYERITGPNTSEWVPIRGLPAHIPQAFLTFEDPGFEHHRGYIIQALVNSMKANLKRGKFVRGGSTITMQLVKNLWLGREKTITRKAQEIILSSIIEGCFSKSEILDLYVNVVEFGPNVYGIGAASRFYFDKDVAYLEPDEAFYLASILPRPNRSVPPDKGGLETVRKIMRRMAESNQIPLRFVNEQSDVFVEEDAWIGEEDFANE